MFKNENNVETVLRLREMLVRAMMAENDVMQELVLSKLEELKSVYTFLRPFRSGYSSLLMYG